MNRLTANQIDIKECNDGLHVIASIYENEGFRHYEKYPISDLPNNLISLNDLKRFGINVINMKPCRGR